MNLPREVFQKLKLNTMIILLSIVDNIDNFFYITVISDIHIIKENNPLYCLNHSLFSNDKGSRCNLCIRLHCSNVKLLYCRLIKLQLYFLHTPYLYTKTIL